MNQTQIKTATGQSHGKIILIGEHAAVYKQPAIAIPCTSVSADVFIMPATKGMYLYCDLFKGYIGDIPDILASLRTMIYTTLHHLNHSNAALHIKIDSTIPLERGMGSSAAVSAAIIRALYQYYNQPLHDDTLLHLLNISEKMVHGNPSGLDASIVTYNQAILFKKNHYLKPLSIHMGGYLIIADSGITGRTKLAIQKVAQLQQTNPNLHKHAISRIGELTLLTSQCLQHKNLHRLGQHLNEAHYWLQHLNVSHEKIDKMVTTAKKHGAIGAKLTGGGLGGCMIAVSQTLQQANDIAHQLEQIGAIKTYVQPI